MIDHHQDSPSGIFVVGGGGYACSSFGAGSGHFEYFVVRPDILQSFLYLSYFQNDFSIPSCVLWLGMVTQSAVPFFVHIFLYPDKNFEIPFDFLTTFLFR